MGHFGHRAFGKSSYGGTSIDFSVTNVVLPSVSAVNIIAVDTLEIVFSTYMRNSALLKNPTSYTVVPVSVGDAVAVTSVKTDSLLPAVLSVFIHITKPTQNVYYTVAVVGAVTDADGDLLETSSAVIKTRKTKTDDVVLKAPKSLSMDKGSLVRKIYNAISISDDKIGGSKKNYKELVR